MAREEYEHPDPRHRRPATPVVTVVLLICGLLLAAAVGGGAIVYLLSRAKTTELRAQAEEEANRARLAESEGRAGAGKAAVSEHGSQAARVGVYEPMTLDGLTVRMVFVRIGKARVFADRETLIFEDKQDAMLVGLEIRNGAKGQASEYRTWRAKVRRLAVDDDGRAYAGRLGPFPAEYPSFPSTTSLDPGEKISDTLVFDPPHAEAQYIDLDLPGKNAGVDGVFRFRIPRAAWAKK